MKQPCESIVMDFLPTIRAELSKRLKKKGLKQSEIADIVGTSKPAVSQYINNKRGSKMDLNVETREKIEEAANEIVEGDKKARNKICEICNFVKDNELGCKLGGIQEEQVKEGGWLISSQL